MRRGKELKKLDKLLQEAYRKKRLRCEVCNGEYSCQHHYIPKSQSTYLRYDKRNLISICVKCHFRHHNGDPEPHARILEKRGIEWHNELQKDKIKIVKINKKYLELINELIEVI